MCGARSADCGGDGLGGDGVSTALARNTDNAPAISNSFDLGVDGIVERKRKIVQVMQAVMKEGEHYGKIPGCGDKPTLLKSGAEVLATTFGLAPKFKIDQTDFANGHREYRITCTLEHIASGFVLGEGVGICSTLESKYRWRKGQRTCPECGQAAIIRSKFGQGGWLCYQKRGGCGAEWPNGAREIEDQNGDRVENTDIADTYNTVLKLAKKRAQVDCTLTAVGASDLLTQDLEDLAQPEPRVEYDEGERREPARRDSKPSSQPPTRTEAIDAEFVELDEEAAERLAKVLIPKVAECRTEAEVKALFPEYQAIQNGTKARHDVYQAIMTKKAVLEKKGGAA